MRRKPTSRLPFFIPILFVIGWMILVTGMQTTVCEQNYQSVDSDLRSFDECLEYYFQLGNTYPSNEQGLQALVAEPTTKPLPERWMQLLREVPNDQWDTPYRYHFPGRKNPDKPEIISAGPDRTFETEDDLSNLD